MSDNITVQCINISIISDNDDELEYECFMFSLSTTDLHSLTVNVPLATICISDDDGMHMMNIHTEWECATSDNCIPFYMYILIFTQLRK